MPWESASRIARRAQVEDTAACPRWPEEFWRLALTHGSGGTCFESNYAFFNLLRRLGFEAYLTINNMQETIGCHTAIVVNLDGARWLADVGIPLYAPIPLDPSSITQAPSRFHTYTITPTGVRRFTIERDRHPQSYIFSLVDEPVDEGSYRAAIAADYGPAGFFLDRVVINRVVDGHPWRFNSAEQPLHLEEFADGRRYDHALGGDPAASLAACFQMDENTLHLALQMVGQLGDGR